MKNARLVIFYVFWLVMGIVLVCQGRGIEQLLYILGVLFFITILYLLGNNKYGTKDKRTVEMDNTSFEMLDGVKIRRIYLEPMVNTFLIVGLNMILVFGVKILQMWIISGNIDDFIKVLFACGIAGILVTFLIYIICIINKYFFGKILCTICEDGIYLKDTFISWMDIERITYEPEFWKKYLNSGYVDSIYFFIKGQNEPYKVEHFPIYGYRMVKKKNPEVKIEFKGVKSFLIGMLIVDLIFILILCLA